MARLSLIDEDLAKSIGATGQQVSFEIKGIHDTELIKQSGQIVKLKVRNIQNGEFFTLTEVQTIKNLLLPSQSLYEADTAGLDHLEGIHINYYVDAVPKLLIGQDCWDLIESRSLKEGSKNSPVASLTSLGWVIHGKANRQANFPERGLSFAIRDDDEAIEIARRNDEYLHELVKQNFGLESIGIHHGDRVSERDQRALQILNNSTRRLTHGWETGLLSKSDSINLPPNRLSALNRLWNLENKLDSKPTFADKYYEEMQKLIDKGYAVKVTEHNPGPRDWYLPHFAVNNKDKIRLVFDAAARSHKVSLNDALMKGPDLLKTLFGVLLRFRQHRVAFKGDIKEMFLRIDIKDEDRRSQMFLWRGRNRTRNPDVYCMTTLIFGAKSSPCSALHVKNSNANEYEKVKPAAASMIKNNTYMDDLLGSVPSKIQAISLIEDIRKINESGGFYMHSWASNSREVMGSIPQEQRAPGTVSLQNNSKENEYEKVLGLS